LSDIPIIGPILFQQQPLTYVMLILAFVIHYVLFYTPWGTAAPGLSANIRVQRYVGH
jgi:simple sugar transport system permease protein